MKNATSTGELKKDNNIYIYIIINIYHMYIMHIRAFIVINAIRMYTAFYKHNTGQLFFMHCKYI